jgi:hypothetical protein
MKRIQLTLRLVQVVVTVNLVLSWLVKQKRATDQQMSVLTALSPAALTCTSEVVHTHIVERGVVHGTSCHLRKGGC